MNQKICPACGAVIEAENARFCPQCGAPIPEEEPGLSEAAKLERRIRDRYQSYSAWTDSVRQRESVAQRLLGLITSRSEFKSSEEHTRFFDDLKAMTEAQEQAYREAPGTGEPEALLRFALLDCHRGVRQEADWMFLAAEQLYLPFLPLLTKEQAAVLLPEYQALRKRNTGFEFQKKILKTLKSMGE